MNISDVWELHEILKILLVRIKDGMDLSEQKKTLEPVNNMGKKDIRGLWWEQMNFWTAEV